MKPSLKGLNADESKQVKKGLCVWQTAYGLPWTEYCQEKATDGQHCAEHAADLKDLNRSAS